MLAAFGVVLDDFQTATCSDPSFPCQVFCSVPVRPSNMSPLWYSMPSILSNERFSSIKTTTCFMFMIFFSPMPDTEFAS